MRPSSSANLTSSSDTASPAEPADSNQDDPGPAKRARLDSGVTITLPRHIMAAAPVLNVADRFRLSAKQLTATVAAVIRSAEPLANISDFNISITTSRRQRLRRRSEVARNLRASFIPPPHAVVHWDGKMIKDIRGAFKKSSARP